ncbi:HSF-type DNA-binding-domain-containing protein [Phycomyces nitens]|nr:HSF-type DNA-binding-domain-containing protein [Phycomyces nitens]
MRNRSTDDPLPATSVLQGRSLTTFIKKLWFIMNDTSIQNLISWSDNGQAICVPNSATFAKSVLPRYFKHSNWPSFVRQLNLYGFRKVYHVGISPEVTQHAVWQFKHEYFQQNASDLLQNIRRRAPQQQPDPNGSTEDFRIQDESQLEHISERLKELQHALYLTERRCDEMRKETTELRTIQRQQQEVINRILGGDFTINNTLSKPNTETKESPSSSSSSIETSSVRHSHFHTENKNSEPAEWNQYRQSEPNPDSIGQPSRYPKDITNTILPSLSSMISDESNESRHDYASYHLPLPRSIDYPERNEQLFSTQRHR